MSVPFFNSVLNRSIKNPVFFVKITRDEEGPTYYEVTLNKVGESIKGNMNYSELLNKKGERLVFLTKEDALEIFTTIIILNNEQLGKEYL